MPGGAAAEPFHRETEACPNPTRRDAKRTCIVQFTLDASNGYRVTVWGEPGGPDHDAVTILVERPGSFANYTGDGTVTASGIDADFGGFGEIAVRFHPRKVARARANGCSGGPKYEKARLGVFTGTIRFSGEGGYTEVSARNARGRASYPAALGPKPVCLRYPGPVGVTLLALVNPDGPAFLITSDNSYALRDEVRSKSGQPGYFFTAVDGEKAGEISISRQAYAVGPPEAFSFDDALTTATIAPPAPFSGTATFERAANGSKTLTGSLAVTLPGKETVPLAGPEVHADLHRLE